MKTVFITSFNPFILRNLLIGDMLKILRQTENIRIVVFVPDYKVDFFKQEIGSSGILIEGIKPEQSSRQDAIFRYFSSSLVNTSSLLVHKKIRLAQSGNWPRFLVSWLFMKLLSRFKIIKGFFRRLDHLTIEKERFAWHFETYQPDLVFATDIFNDNDVHMLAGAAHYGIRTVAMVRSWDNITNKGMFRIKPGAVIVHNEWLKEQVVRYDDMDKKDIFVSGIPQYDRYVTKSRMDRKEFFARLGLDINRGLILFSPLGKRFSDTDWQIMEILKRFIEDKRIPPVQVLVRFPPNDDVPLGKFIPNKYFYIDRPGQGFRKGVFYDRELVGVDMDWLADSLHHSDVVVAGGASIGIDAAIFGKPTILISFDGFGKKPYSESAEHSLQFDHVRTVIDKGAFRVAKNKEDLEQHLNDYLAESSWDREARKQLLIEQCWKLDGQSGKRIADFILDSI